MANYNYTISLYAGGSSNQYFWTQNVQTGDTLSIRINNTHSGYNGWGASISSGDVTPDPVPFNSSGSAYGASPASPVVFTINSGTYYRIIFYSFYRPYSGYSNPYRTHHIRGTVTAGTATYSLSPPTSIQEGTTGTVNISATNHTAGTVYWSATPAADFSPNTGSTYVNTSGTGSFSLSPVADNTTEGNETATVRLFTNSLRTVQVASTTTTITDQGATGGGGGGTGGGTSGGSTTQGIEVFSQNGTKVFGTDLRTQNVQYEQSVSIAANSTSSTFSMADANDSTKVLITLLGYYPPSRFTINTSSTGFSITNNSNGTQTANLLAIRIG